MLNKDTIIVIIDYGMGNLNNVKNSFNKIGFNPIITNDFHKIEKATHLILPGVGGFKDAMKELKNKDLIQPIKDAISNHEFVSFLGICLGMQLLFESSEEFGETEGLGILKGKVIKFNENFVPIIPHIGWNDINIKKNGIKEFKNIKNNSFFYFLHSYYCKPDDDAIIAASCYYYETFAACVKKDNIFACQFHPEKSHDAGLTLLKNFVS
ncbi:MAG: imidazole glycerol phosphate synthase subunit HisH [Deltaproteobacteria bacterium]|nr:imidazole glycerol phosphate synthase subunit HisH [Deltaproteobacteria bacterium]